MIDYKTTPISQMSIYENLVAKYVAAQLSDYSNLSMHERTTIIERAKLYADDTIKLFNQKTS